MKNIFKILGMFSLIGLMTASFAHSTMLDHQEWLIARGTSTLEGTLMKIEGSFYVIMDSAGTERRVHVDGRTEIIGHITAGSKVQAVVTSEGHASELKKVGG